MLAHTCLVILDSDPAYAAENIVDGAFFNSGQSCCGIERVYVHESIYDTFVEEFVKVVKVSYQLSATIHSYLNEPTCTQDYKLGDPRLEETTLGPVISLRSAANIRAQISEASALSSYFINNGSYSGAKQHM